MFLNLRNIKGKTLYFILLFAEILVWCGIWTTINELNDKIFQDDTYTKFFIYSAITVIGFTVLYIFHD